MIDHLNNLIRHVLMDGVADVTSDTQVRFQPPDDDWKNYVTNLTVNGNPANAVNVYLVDVRSNLKLRTNETTRRVEFGVAFDDPPPARIDCHYLLTAWSPTAVTTGTEPAI